VLLPPSNFSIGFGLKHTGNVLITSKGKRRKRGTVATQQALLKTLRRNFFRGRNLPGGRGLSHMNTHSSFPLCFYLNLCSGRNIFSSFSIQGFIRCLFLLEHLNANVSGRFTT
jgi:hypothetical protein